MQSEAIRKLWLWLADLILRMAQVLRPSIPAIFQGVFDTLQNSAERIRADVRILEAQRKANEAAEKAKQDASAGDRLSVLDRLLRRERARKTAEVKRYNVAKGMPPK